MGQRLVITMTSGQENVACCYWHWDGYTHPSKEHVDTILDKFFELEDSGELATYEKLGKDGRKLLSIRLFEATGATLSEKGMDAARKMFPGQYGEKTEAHPDRNEGIIDIDPEEIKQTRGWSEADVTIDLDFRMVIFDVYGILQEDADVDGMYDGKMVMTTECPPRFVDAGKATAFTFENWGDMDDILQDMDLRHLYNIGDGGPGFMCAIE